MKTVHLLRVDPDPRPYAPLVKAAAAEGLRVGWLDLGRPEEPAPASEALAAAAATGVLRAVACGADGSVAVKPRRGPLVLRDLLREHFLGCRLVLVVPSPELAATSGSPVFAGVSGSVPDVAATSGRAASDAPDSVPDSAATPGDAALLEPAGTGRYRLHRPGAAPGEPPLELTASELAGRLRRPRPW